MFKTIKTAVHAAKNAILQINRKKAFFKHVYNYNYNSVILDISHVDTNIKNSFFDNSYERSELELAKIYVSSDDHILELGSGLGFISLFLLKEKNITNYCVVEANPKTVKKLEINYSKNNRVPNLIQCAVSNTTGKIQFLDSNSFWLNRISSTDSSNTIEVECDTLPNIVSKSGLKPTVIICDIEGGELVIKPTDIPITVKLIIIEIHPTLVSYPKAYKHLSHFITDGWQVKDVRANTFALIRN